MVYKIVFAPQAETELNDGIAYYEEQKEGLGVKLYGQILEQIDLIKVTPFRFPVVEEIKKVRRALIQKFNYSILFIVREESITIVAIMHNSRDPKRWKERTK